MWEWESATESHRQTRAKPSGSSDITHVGLLPTCLMQKWPNSSISDRATMFTWAVGCSNGPRSNIFSLVIYILNPTAEIEYSQI